MNFFRLFGLWLTLAVLAGASMGVHAEDIDIYSDNSDASGTPNVLLVLDNAANFSASAGNCTYVDGTAPSLNGTAGGIEQCALYNVVSGLPAGSVNLGLMVYNATNIRDINHGADSNANCGGTNGGCLVVPLMPMDNANKAKFLTWVKSWRTSGGGGDGYIKANGEATAAVMQETWAYYAGKTGLSGRDYATAQPASGCQKNFVIFVGNAFNTSGTPSDTGNVSPKTALDNAPGITEALKTPIVIPSGPYGARGGISCGSYDVKTHNESTGVYADEWARYMRQTDIYGGLDDNQSITTYTVGLLGASCKPDYPALLSTMAKHGGGKYFATSSYEEIADALLTILNEVQAVNSVFSSASLPVSVNAQGTYLNQIFLGMFRPDASASPRWLGNLKQYKFILEYPDPNNPDPNKASLRLGDSLGNSAISSAGTGFITPSAVSFWTHKDTAVEPDASGGFFKNDARGAGGAYDSADGELVEKGGAAQRLRKENLTADFGATAGGSSNPRRLYTYCPSGSSCEPLLTHASNAFAIENADIAATSFGASNTIPIASIVRTGTSAVVTTTDNHGFTEGTTVTISGADQAGYNVTTGISSASGRTFTISGLPDQPTTPSQGAYTIAKVGPGAVTATSVTGELTASNTVKVTVTSAAGHGFADGSTVTIAGATPGNFNGNVLITVPNTMLCPAATCFTYEVPVSPVLSATNAYQAVISPNTLTISELKGNGSYATVKTATAHGFHAGQTVTLAGTTTNPAFDGDKVIYDIVDANQFRIVWNQNKSGVGGSVSPSTTAKAITTLGRTGSTATATGLPAKWFGNRVSAVNQVTKMNITKTGGSGGNESAYVVSDVTITCSNDDCTTFTYPVTVSPGTTISGTITASPPSAASATMAAGSITRSNATAAVTGLPSGLFNPGDSVTILPSGSGLDSEAGYVGTWTLGCTSPCTSATFGPVPLTPATPATGGGMRVYSGSTPPDRNSLIKWVRGQDNFGDEAGPGGSVTVRPSIHGDVLHSRPVVVNYGDSRGMVVFYGGNDGVFRAVNGSQAQSLGSVSPGGELWGLILPEHFSKLNRQRVNSPELRMPSTLLPSAAAKDYFVDGSPGVYQKLKPDGTVDKAYLYLNMRRGGRFIYALDVSDPTAPQVLWRKSPSDTGFEELGQTWSRPRVTLVKGYANPVVVFGAGYDTAEDSEPPKADTMGRGIFVLDAESGALVWKATFGGTDSCGGTSIQGACTVTRMKYAIPSDVTFLDRDGDGKTDRFYVGDLGGIVWRVDLEPTAGNTPNKWLATRLAALGCSSGSCSSGTTPRKFFYPPSVVMVGKTSGDLKAYDAVAIASGDREHPLKNTEDESAYRVSNRFYLLKDTDVDKDSSGNTRLDQTDLVDLGTVNDTTPTVYDGTGKGFYLRFATGEKAVNAPITTRGTTFFGTNRPTPPKVNSCRSNLGEAKGYAVNPFTGKFEATVYDGGGLPPSPIAGVVNIGVNGRDVQMPFCIGCGKPPDDEKQDCDSNSALGACKLTKTVPKNLHRTYWYKK